ncbi:hypothetical protein [Acinetobacter shaoyimingii]|nr:hypothetical protein [Acinetobacter shaoyimingii]
MDTPSTKKAMHPLKTFLIELFSVRAGLYIDQRSTNKEMKRG